MLFQNCVYITLCAQELWPRLEGSYSIQEGQEVRLTVAAGAEVTMEPVPTFPVNYALLNEMAAVGDTIFIGRYLVCIPCCEYREFLIAASWRPRPACEH